MLAREWDDVVVGAGIVGLATAYHLARRGRRVVVFERSDRAIGASIRNFGMLWPIGQPAGPDRELALRSLELWRELLDATQIWHDPCGSLHLAYRDDEANVLREFAAGPGAAGLDGALIGPDEIAKRSPSVRLHGLRCGFLSRAEICVDSRQVITSLPQYLAETYGVRFEFGRTVIGYDQPLVRLADGETWAARRLWLCSGAETQILYPSIFREHGALACKLQMLRTEPVTAPWRLGPMLAAGLTLRHYRSFDGCPSLPALRDRVARETPEFDRFGIHVMASQNGLGEVVLGDSHEYGAAIGPDERVEIESLILNYLRMFLEIPNFRIAARWSGIYAKLPHASALVALPAPGATVIGCLGGAGMTLSFGISERTVVRVLEEQI